MFFTILDLVLILIIFVFIAFGFVLGLISAIGSIVGIVLGTWLAGMFYQPLAEWLTPIFLGHSVSASIIAFILIFTLVNRVTGLVFWMLNKIFNLISFIPFTKSLNRILGAVLGFIEGVLAIGIVLYFISRLPITEWFSEVILNSFIAQFFIKTSSFLAPLLPDVIKVF